LSANKKLKRRFW